MPNNKMGYALDGTGSNMRTSVHSGKRFLRLTQQAVAVETVPYAGLVKGVRKGRSRKYKTL